MIGRMRSWLNDPVVTPTMAKAFVIAVAGAAVAAPFAAVAVPYLDFFNDMAVQYKVKPQMVWLPADAGLTPVSGDRPSAAHTIPREFVPYPFPDPAPSVAEQAGLALQPDNQQVAPAYRPPVATPAMLELGKRKFETTCIVCHGQYGFGDGSVVRAGFPTPPSLQAAQARNYPIGRLFHIATMGQNVMPGYATQLLPEERWAVVYYVRALQRAFPAPPAEPGPAPPTPEDAGSNAAAPTSSAAASARSPEPAPPASAGASPPVRPPSAEESPNATP